MCIFCKIINKEVKAEIVYEDDNVLAFKDIKPKSSVHILVIPKEHISTLNEIDEKNSHLIAKVMESIPKIAKKLKIENGYRIINNCGAAAGQEVFHIHFHLQI